MGQELVDKSGDLPRASARVNPVPTLPARPEALQDWLDLGARGAVVFPRYLLPMAGVLLGEQGQHRGVTPWHAHLAPARGRAWAGAPA